jgi:hypothetical protein
MSVKNFSKWAGVIGRYLLAAPLAGVLTFLVMEAQAGRHEDFNASMAVVWAYGVASLTWVVVAVLEPSRTRWRLLLIWAPEVLPIAFTASVVIQGDNTGLGAAIGLLLVAIPLAPCILGSLVALFYRPRDRAPIPSAVGSSKSRA